MVRASYARYAGQLNSFETTQNNAAGVYYPYLAYGWVDRNGDHLASRDEVLVNGGRHAVVRPRAPLDALIAFTGRSR